MVDMDDVVSGLDGRQLLERQGELSRTGAVALEGVFVETVENLVVGEETAFQPVVDEPLMEGGRRGGERNLVGTFLEDGVETLGLFLGIGQDINLVALTEEFQERG